MVRKVTVETWRGERDMLIADALTPECDTFDALNAVIGELLVLLVECGVVPLDDAGAIVGQYAIKWATD